MTTAISLNTVSRLPAFLPAVGRGLSVLAAFVNKFASSIFLGFVFGIVIVSLQIWIWERRAAGGGRELAARIMQGHLRIMRDPLILWALEIQRDRHRPAGRDLPLASDARPVAAGDVHPAVLANLSINKGALARTPALFDPSMILQVARDASPPIEAREILAQFDRIFAGAGRNTILCHDDRNAPITVAGARVAILTDYVTLHPLNEYEASVAANIRLFLVGIVSELRKPDVPQEKKQTALIDLVLSARHCFPRRYEQALKTYRTLSNQVETLEQIVLQLLQQVKEDLFREYYSLSLEPVMTLNFIRKLVGRELGLDCDPIHLNDPHMSAHNDARSPQNPGFKHMTASQFRRVFFHIYNPESVLRIMRQRLNDKIANNNDFCREITQYISDAVPADQKGALPAPYQFDYDHATPYQLTDDGIRFLLVHFGILNER